MTKKIRKRYRYEGRRKQRQLSEQSLTMWTTTTTAAASRARRLLATRTPQQWMCRSSLLFSVAASSYSSIHTCSIRTLCEGKEDNDDNQKRLRDTLFKKDAHGNVQWTDSISRWSTVEFWHELASVSGGKVRLKWHSNKKFVNK
jgi:hypothetical protein